MSREVLRAFALAFVLALALTGCLNAKPYQCGDGTDCVRGGVSGRCEANDRCSFPSGTCPSGWAYHDPDGPLDEMCVGDDTVPDAGLDAPDGIELQLLAILIQGYDGSADDGGWRVLVRTRGTSTWTEIEETSPPSSNCDRGLWADCCGADGPDGLPELLVRCWHRPYVVRLTRVDDGLLGLTPLQLESGAANTDEALVTWFDGDGDGDLDIVRGHPDLAFHANTGGAFTLQPPLASGEHGMAAGNWDDDPAPELAVAGEAGVRVLERGDGSWSESYVVDTTDLGVKNVMWCDHRGDPHPDLVAASSGSLRLFANRGQSAAGQWLDVGAPLSLYGATGDSRLPMACVDVDGDGGQDVVFRADGLFVVPHGGASRVEIGSDLTPRGLELADVDDDGRPDLVIVMDAPRRVEVWRNTSQPGAVSFASPTIIATTSDLPLGVAITSVVLPRR